MSAEEQKETLQNALSKLSGIEEKDVKTLIRIIDRDWTLAVDAKNIVSNKLNAILTPAQITSINNKIDALEAAPAPDFSVEKNDLAETFIQTLDSTVVLEKPKLRGYIHEMIVNIATVLNIPANMVNIKATSNEGMGFIGRGEGVAAFAVVTVRKKQVNKNV